VAASARVSAAPADAPTSATINCRLDGALPCLHQPVPRKRIRANNRSGEVPFLRSDGRGLAASAARHALAPLRDRALATAPADLDQFDQKEEQEREGNQAADKQPLTSLDHGLAEMKLR
jgi:hypothetical protein